MFRIHLNEWENDKKKVDWTCHVDFMIFSTVYLSLFDIHKYSLNSFIVLFYLSIFLYLKMFLMKKWRDGKRSNHFIHSSLLKISKKSFLFSFSSHLLIWFVCKSTQLVIRNVIQLRYIEVEERRERERWKK